MRRTELSYILALISFLIFSGCLTEQPQDVTPTVTPMVTGVRILTAPNTGDVGSSVTIFWRVDSPVGKTIPHTAVHYGPESRSEPLTLQSYPNLTTPQTGSIPANFTASMMLNRVGITYYRAHAIIDGVDYWSDERTITVSESRTARPPEIKVIAYPARVEGEADFTIDWEVSDGTPGNISSTSVIWGFNRGGETTTDYPRKSTVQTGKAPEQFSAGLKAPAGGGPIYFRVQAIVDDTQIFSEEYPIFINPRYTGGGGGY